MKKNVTLSYYPGCSLSSTARENNASLVAVFERLGVLLEELPDWNCCGSSSAHSIDADLALWLPARNLALAPPGRPLLVACPSCLLHLRQAKGHLDEHPAARRRFRLKPRFGPGRMSASGPHGVRSFCCYGNR